MSRGRSRRTEWFVGPGGTGVSTLTTSAASILGSGIITTFGEETVVRTRGLVDCSLISSTSAGDGYFGAVGIGLVSSAAFTAGATAVPTPINEQGWDGWLFHHFFSVHEDSPDGQGSGSAHHRFEIDSKAMRKVQEDETLYAAIEVVEIGTAVMNVFLDTRVLSKLP